MFSKKAKSKDGLQYECKECNRLKCRAHHQANRETYKEKRLQYYKINKAKAIEVDKIWKAQNKEKVLSYKAKWRLENRDLANELSRKWSSNNISKRRAYRSKRRASELQRTPKWVDSEEIWLIAEVFDLAVKRSIMTGIKWHVDHIIPLQGKLVSGLHTVENLQVIPAKINMRKGNRYNDQAT